MRLQAASPTFVCTCSCLPQFDSTHAHDYNAFTPFDARSRTTLNAKMIRADVEKVVGRLMSSHEAGVAISSESAWQEAVLEGKREAQL